MEDEELIINLLITMEPDSGLSDIHSDLLAMVNSDTEVAVLHRLIRV